jgi:hypothetical protein
MDDIIVIKKEITYDILTFRTLNVSKNFFVENTNQWLAICLANKEC